MTLSAPLKQGSSAPTRQALLSFFVLVFALAVPFLVLGAVTGRELMPNLPIASLMAICPTLAALILSFRAGGGAAASTLIRRSFDARRIKAKAWLAPALLMAPAVGLLNFGVLRLTGTPVPNPEISVLPTLVLCAIFFVGALGEELGWSGYAIDPMQERCGALIASLALGVIWAVFHLVALRQAHHAAEWIGWWSLGTVALRVVLVWLYNNTGSSVFVAALSHMTFNVVWQLFPIHGSFMDQRINGLIWALAATIVVIVWGPRTLAERWGRNTPQGKHNE